MSAASGREHGHYCPKPDELLAFAVGQLPEDTSETIALHIEACPDCLATLQELNDRDDPLLADLRTPVPEGLFAADDRRLATSLSGGITAASGGKEPSPARGAVLTDTAIPAMAPKTCAAGGPPPVPGYEIIEEVGRGGMGVVYKARQRGLNRLVALKMILAGVHAGSQHRARFRIEAEAVAQLEHPNIVQIHEVGEQEGLPYLSLEFVDGGSLAQRLDGTPMAPDRAARLVQTLARAMEHAHRRGVIHRDLKPANVLLTADSVPKISDFGLAKRLELDAVTLANGAVMGTPSYMAPEQAAGNAKEIGPATDVYALGAILYELLTGRPPFKAETPSETLLQVRTQEPVSPRRLQHKLLHDLTTICLKCLAKEPRRRYASAEALADDLQRFLAGEPIRARPVGVGEWTWKWARRRPAAAALMALTFLVPALLTVVLAVSNIRITQAWQSESEAKSQLADTLERQRRDLYFQRIARAYAEWLTNNVGRAEAVLDECPLDLRGWEWRYLKRLCHTDLLTLRGHKGEVRGVAFSPDGRHLASAGGDNTVKIWEVRTGKELLTLAGHTAGVSAVAYSPDGRYLASASQDRSVKIWDANNGKDLLTLEGHTDSVSKVMYSPDGRHLASGSSDKTVIIWEAATGQLVRTLTENTEVVWGVAYSPDGEYLASAGGDCTVRVWEAATGRLARILRSHSDTVLSVAFSPDSQKLVSTSYDRTAKIWSRKTWTDQIVAKPVFTIDGPTSGMPWAVFSPDGKKLATGGWDPVVRVWDATDGQQLLTLRGHTDPTVTSVAFSPDGSYLASASGDGTVKLWKATVPDEITPFINGRHRQVAPSPDGRLLATAGWYGPGAKVWDLMTGKLLVALGGHAGQAWSTAFSSDGRLLATGGDDAAVKIWDTTTWKELQTLAGHGQAVFGVAFSPDGKWLASASKDRTLKLWNADTGQEIRTFEGHAGAVTGVAFSPDGRHLASASADKTLRIWDAATGNETGTFQAHTGSVNGLAFSPDGRFLASTSDDQTARIWELATGKELRSLKGHGRVVLGVAYSPDGQRLATAGHDYNVKLWDAETGQEILTLRGNRGSGSVFSVAFTRDGKRLISGSNDVKIWNATPLEEKASQE